MADRRHFEGAARDLQSRLAVLRRLLQQVDENGA